MDVSQKLVWTLYSGGVTALTALATKQLVDGAWQFVTGNEPPEPNDPATGAGEAVAWVLALAVGVGLTSVLVNRFAAKRWEQFTGQASPVRTVSLRL